MNTRFRLYFGLRLAVLMSFLFIAASFFTNISVAEAAACDNVPITNMVIQTPMESQYRLFGVAIPNLSRTEAQLNVRLRACVVGSGTNARPFVFGTVNEMTLTPSRPGWEIDGASRRLTCVNDNTTSTGGIFSQCAISGTARNPSPIGFTGTGAMEGVTLQVNVGASSTMTWVLYFDVRLETVNGTTSFGVYSYWRNAQGAFVERYVERYPVNTKNKNNNKDTTKLARKHLILVNVTPPAPTPTRRPPTVAPTLPPPVKVTVYRTDRIEKTCTGGFGYECVDWLAGQGNGGTVFDKIGYISSGESVSVQDVVNVQKKTDYAIGVGCSTTGLPPSESWSYSYGRLASSSGITVSTGYISGSALVQILVVRRCTNGVLMTGIRKTYSGHSYATGQ